jgi:hypothetical protein
MFPKFINRLIPAVSDLDYFNIRRYIRDSFRKVDGHTCSAISDYCWLLYLAPCLYFLVVARGEIGGGKRCRRGGIFLVYRSEIVYNIWYGSSCVFS